MASDSLADIASVFTKLGAGLVLSYIAYKTVDANTHSRDDKNASAKTVATGATDEEKKLLYAQAAKKDEFATVAKNYVKFRPNYPASVMECVLGYFLVQGSTGIPDSTVLDVGTGSGQMAVVFAERGFSHVIGLDKSQKQLDNAKKHPRVEYRVGTELNTGVADQSVQLVCAAQAAHWFDLPKFLSETNRVLSDDGVLVITGYAICSVDQPAEAQPMFAKYYESLRSFWPGTCDRKLVDSGFASIDFQPHFGEVQRQWFNEKRTLTVADFIGYVRTWSAHASFLEKNKEDPATELEKTLTKLCEATDGMVTINTPFFVVNAHKK